MAIRRTHAAALARRVEDARDQARSDLSALRSNAPEIAILLDSKPHVELVQQAAQLALGERRHRIWAGSVERDVLSRTSPGAWLLCVQADSTRIDAYGALSRLRNRAAHAIPVAICGWQDTAARARLIGFRPLFFELGEAVRMLPHLIELAAIQRRHLAQALEQEFVANAIATEFGHECAREFGYVNDVSDVKSLPEVERDALRTALSAADGNRTTAAELLEVSRATLYRMIKRHGLSEATAANPPVSE